MRFPLGLQESKITLDFVVVPHGYPIIIVGSSSNDGIRHG